MATTITHPDKPPHSSSRLKRVLKPSLIVLVVAAALLQLRYDIYLFGWSAPGQDDTVIANLIIQAIQGFTKPAVIEPVSKKIYLPDASIVLPPYSEGVQSGILYTYTPSFDGSDAEANITLTGAQSSAIAKLRIAQQTNGRIWTSKPGNVFDAVPNAQACSRGLAIDFGTKSPGFKLELSQKLADGRTMNVYSEKHPCSYDLQPLVDYLKQAQSY